MPSTEQDALGPGFEWRLKAALDRVTPPSSNPRYASGAVGSARAWPVGPALVAAGAAMLLAITASAFTGSANPVVWAERAGSTLQTVGHEASPAPESSPAAHHSAPAGPAQPTHEPDREPAETPEPPEPKESPEPKERPEPAEASGEHSGQRPAATSESD